MKLQDLLKPILIVGLANWMILLTFIIMLFSPLGHVPGPMPFPMILPFLYLLFISGPISIIAIAVGLFKGNVKTTEIKKHFLTFGFGINLIYCLLYAAMMCALIIGGQGI
jgi:hypothetical protein